ncbi:MAG: response regulator [Pseudomonadota bacterium]
MAINVLFVDDETNVLQGLRRSLRSMRKEWNMQFAASGAEALELLAQEPVDVVISDMRMPEMDGAELLEAVSKNYPYTVRFVLSGQADRDTTYRAVGPSHQFFSKPCDADVLADTLRRTLSLQALLSKGAVCAISGLRCLPTPAQQRNALNAALKQEQITIDITSSLIARDPGMSLKALQLTNSTYFGVGATVFCPSQASKMLDIDVFQDLAKQGRFSIPLINEEKASEYTELVDLSYLTGLVCKRISALEGASAKDQTLAFAAGLCCFLGDLVAYTQGGACLTADDKRAAPAYLATLWGAPHILTDILSGEAADDPLRRDMILYLSAARRLAGAVYADVLGGTPEGGVEVSDADLEKWREECFDLIETARAA